jgi:hypothetical protein
MLLQVCQHGGFSVGLYGHWAFWRRSLVTPLLGSERRRRIALTGTPLCVKPLAALTTGAADAATPQASTRLERSRWALSCGAVLGQQRTALMGSSLGLWLGLE